MTLSTLTVSGQDYQSYASLAEANRIMAVDPIRRTTWAAKSDDDKKILLIASTERHDLLSWLGKKTGSASQKNAWPRRGLKYPDGSNVPDDAIPDDLARSTALLAGSIAIRPAHADHGSSGQNISKIKAGSVQIDYFRSQRIVSGVPLGDETAYALIRKWLSGSRAVSAGEATGVNSDSSFSDPREFDINPW